MRKEIYTYKGEHFEIKTVSKADSFEESDLIVVLKHDGKLLNFYHSHYETVQDCQFQNNVDLENKLYEIAKSEIESGLL
jgi:hypothetical protein